MRGLMHFEELFITWFFWCMTRHLGTYLLPNPDEYIEFNQSIQAHVMYGTLASYQPSFIYIRSDTWLEVAETLWGRKILSGMKSTHQAMVIELLF